MPCQRLTFANFCTICTSMESTDLGLSQFRVNYGGGNAAGCFEVEVRADTVMYCYGKSGNLHFLPFLSTPVLLQCSLGVSPITYRIKFFLKTIRVCGLLDGGDCVLMCLLASSQHQCVTDTQLWYHRYPILLHLNSFVFIRFTCVILLQQLFDNLFFINVSQCVNKLQYFVVFQERKNVFQFIYHRRCLKMKITYSRQFRKESTSTNMIKSTWNVRDMMRSRNTTPSEGFCVTLYLFFAIPLQFPNLRVKS